jgi:carboxypeptidase family protein/TonB-dependent receptor-like protein
MGKRNSACLPVALFVVVSVFGIAARTEAQTVTGTIVGTVLDAQGAAIPNATVSARNRETALERTAISESAGEFTVTSVPAGPYDVTISAPGFRQEVRSGITMTVGATVRLDFKLAVGDVQQKVVVTSEAPQIDTTTSTLSGLVSDTSIRQLPLNGRDWLQLTALQAGVLVGLTKNPDPGENVTHGGGVFLTVSGGRPTSNVFMVDGLVINDEANKSPGGSVHGVNLGVDAIREFSVLTSTFGAEYGRSSGGVVNAITKSGTNDIHGTGFGFLRNSALDSSNFFNGKTNFHRGQFGSAIGGPIKKDKLFWFADYEGIREFKAESAPTYTISDAARSGVLEPIAAAVQPYLAMFPVANGPVVAGSPYLAQYSFPGGTRGTEDYVIGRIDYVANSKNTIHGTYMFDRSVASAPDSVGEKLIGDLTRDQRVTLSWQYSFTPTILNTVNTGFTRVVGTGNIDVVGSGTVPILSDPSHGFFPNLPPGIFTIEDLAPGTVGSGSAVPGGVGSTGGDQLWWTDPQVNDNVGWVKGRNDIRFGFSMEAIRDNLSVGRFPQGNWDFATVQDFLANTSPVLFGATVPGPGSYRSLREKIFGLYIQDDIRVRSNLTVNLGVRYEPTTTYNVLNGLGSNCYVLTSCTVATIHLGNPYLLHNPTHKDFTPRVGLAWDPTGSGKTSIRAGFGMFNVLPLPNLLSGNMNHTIPFYQLVNFNKPYAGASGFPGAQAIFPLAPCEVLPGTNPCQVAGATGGSGYYMDPNPPRAYKLQWNVDIQRQLTNSLSVTAAYVGARGVHLPFRYGDVNVVPPSLITTAPDGHLLYPAGTPPRIDAASPALTIPATLWNVDSFYHALQINVVQRISHGLSFQTVYAWAKALDDGSSEVNNADNFNTTDNPDPFNPRFNKGFADWDVPQHLAFNFDWLAPSPHLSMAAPRFLLSGWELGGIYTAQSGMPFSVQSANSDLANTGAHGGFSQRPDYVAGPGCTPGAVNPGSVYTYINVNCFAAPAPRELGNVGRNSLRGPGLNNFDFSIFKNQTVKERLTVQFRAEFFNVFNWTNFVASTQRIFTKSLAPNQTGLSLLTHTATDEREIQFGLKFIY